MLSFESREQEYSGGLTRNRKVKIYLEKKKKERQRKEKNINLGEFLSHIPDRLRMKHGFSLGIGIVDIFPVEQFSEF